jgi:hypothetical protein
MACIKTNLLLSLPRNKYKPGAGSTADGSLLQLLLKALKQTCVADSVFPCAM